MNADATKLMKHQYKAQRADLRSKLINWMIFLALCLIWGSSFLLMKLGLFNASGRPLLSAYHVAGLRIFSAGLVLLPFATTAFRRLPDKSTRIFVLLSGLLGSFFPAFLFCIAETKIDSSLAGAINAMTPLSVLLIGTLVYHSKIAISKWLGIVVGFCGCLLLFFSNAGSIQTSTSFGLFAVLATIFYGLNVNLVKHRLSHASSVDMAAMAFAFLIIPSVIILIATGYFHMPFSHKEIWMASGASVLLGVMGTALASILFYVLVKRTGVVFPSLVTYGIPFVAIAWGMYYGETVSAIQITALMIILGGVYLANFQVAASWSKAKKMLLRKQQK